MLKTLNKQLQEHLEVVNTTPNRTLYRMGGKEGYYTIEVQTSAEGSMIGHFSIYYHNDEGLWDVLSKIICQKDNQLSLAEDILICLAEEEQYRTNTDVYNKDKEGSALCPITKTQEEFLDAIFNNKTTDAPHTHALYLFDGCFAVECYCTGTKDYCENLLNNDPWYKGCTLVELTNPWKR